MLDFFRELVQYLIDNRCEIATNLLVAYSAGVLSKLTVEGCIALKHKWQQRLH